MQVLLFLKPEGLEGLPSLGRACLQPSAVLLKARVSGVQGIWSRCLHLLRCVSALSFLLLAGSAWHGPGWAGRLSRRPGAGRATAGRMAPPALGALPACQRGAPVLQHVFSDVEGEGGCWEGWGGAATRDSPASKRGWRRQGSAGLGAQGGCRPRGGTRPAATQLNQYILAALQGAQLEPSLGSAAFFLLIAELILSSGLIYLLLAAGVALLSPALGRGPMLSCAAGFSSVLFGLKVVLNADSAGWSSVAGFALPSKVGGGV